MARHSIRISVATALSANRFVTSTAMKVGTYTLANSGQPTTPTYSASVRNGRLTTIGISQQGGTSPDDTMGTVAVTGLNVNGVRQTDTITPLANATATGTVPFTVWEKFVGAGWVIDAGDTPTADNIVAGHAAAVIPVSGDGVLKSIVHVVAAAGAITIADSTGTLLVLPSSFATLGVIAVNLPFTGYLSITQVAASDAVYIWDDDPQTVRVS